MAKGKKKKKENKAKLGVATDTEMKTYSKKAEPPKDDPKSLDELIELAQKGPIEAPPTQKKKQAPRGKRSKAQKQRKVDLLERALASEDKVDAKVAKRRMKDRKKAHLSNLCVKMPRL